MTGLNLLLGAALAGALAMFFLDPDRGAYRRNVARDRIGGSARRGAMKAGRGGRHVASDAAGTYKRLAHVAEGIRKDERLDDATLKAKVETELFRDRDVPKGHISVNTVDGVVFLRGEVGTPSEIDDIERRVREIDGVEEVTNLLHLPGTPARHA